MSNQTEERAYGPGRPKKGEDRHADKDSASILKLVSMTDLRDGSVEGRVGKNTMVGVHWRVRINPCRELIALANAMSLPESVVVGLAIHQMAVSKGLDIAPEPPAARPVWIHANVVPLEEVQRHYPPAGSERAKEIREDGFAYVDPMNDPPRFADTDPSYAGKDKVSPSEAAQAQTEAADSAPLLDLLRE